MVLDEAASSGESLNDDSIAAFSDDSSSATANNPFFPPNFKLDLSQYPRPIPLIGPILGYTNRRISNTILSSIVEISRVIQRPLTDLECEAIAYHTANGISITSYSSPIGVIAGVTRQRMTRSTYKFPFYTPDLTKLNPDQFGPLRGMQAQAAWHAVRTGAYVLVGTFFAKVFVGLYAATVAATGERKDMRLQDIVTAISEMGAEAAKKRKDEGTYPARGTSWQGQRPDQSTAMTTDQSDGSSMSRTTRFGGTKDGYGSNVSGSMDTSPMDDGQLRSVETGKPFQGNYSSEEQPRPFDIDDASPTAANDETKASSQQSTGSAWERLRRGGAPQQQPSPQSRSQQQPSMGNAWARTRAQTRQTGPGDDNSPSSEEYAPSGNITEDERRKAREQAQREFDSRVERERMGENFDDDNRKWR